MTFEICKAGTQEVGRITHFVELISFCWLILIFSCLSYEALFLYLERVAVTISKVHIFNS